MVRLGFWGFYVGFRRMESYLFDGNFGGRKGKWNVFDFVDLLFVVFVVFFMFVLW